MSNRTRDPAVEGAAPSPGTLQVSQAPSVTVSIIGACLQPIIDEDGTVEDFRAVFLAAFGTAELVVAEALFEQVLNVLHTDPEKPLDAASANLILSLLYRIRPNDELEAMLTCQLIAAHVASRDASRRALHVEQSAAGRAAYLGLARKLMGLFTTQLDALNRHRGKVTTQKIVIERVLVAPGAQAVVGAVSSGGGGVSDKSSDQPRDPWQRGLQAAQSAPRCGAKTRRGTICQGPAMPNGRCKTHGGRSPGAPRGERNGNWRGGFHSPEGRADRRRGSVN